MNNMALVESAARPMLLTRGPRPSALTKAVFFIGLLFHFGGAFTIQLEFSGTQHSTSKILQITYLALGLFGVVSLLTEPNAVRQTIARCKPILYLIALTFVSALWSTSIGMTLKASFAYLMTNAFALALPARLGDETLPLLTRSMAFACFLSVVWVVVFPATSIHQATDAVQTVHAGLWRGIFSHKQNLGTFSGFTIAVVLYYGRLAFPNIAVRIVALLCAVACLAGSQSATGFLMATGLTGLFYIANAISKLPLRRRKPAVIALAAGMMILFLLFRFDALSFLPKLLGKSEDLSGRGETWLLITSNFAGSGSRIILGGGFASDFPLSISNGLPIDSGYYVKLLEFGYVGALLLGLIYGKILFDSIRTLTRAPSKFAHLAAFPICVLLILIIYSITETGLMDRHITTVFIVIAAYINVSKIKTNEPSPLPAASHRVGGARFRRGRNAKLGADLS